MSDLEACTQEEWDLQVHGGKPIALDLSTALGAAATSNSKSNKPGLPPAARGSCCRPLPRALLFLALLQQKAAASHLAAHSTPATGQLCLLSL